jgi:hypothetical protein
VCGLRLRAGHGFYVDALLGQYRSAASIECPSAPCQFDAVPAWSSSAVNGSLGFGWLSSGGGMDLSYGLSWLQAQPAHPMSHDAASAGFLGGLPMLAVPGLFPYRLDSSTALVANGRWTWSPDAPVIRFGATFGHGRAWSSQPTGILLQPIDLDQASLTLGIGGNTLEGVIVGRMLSSDDPAFAARRWSALDLGVSWRTPWQGELSVGAQNVWSSADAAPADKVDPAQARMPYIRYRQDL